MATKTKKKPAEPNPVDVWELQSAIDENARDAACAYDRQEQIVHNLEQQLAYEKNRLNGMLDAMAMLEEATRSSRAKSAFTESSSFDFGLFAAIQKLAPKKTGVIGWDQLKKCGATNAQIETNLRNTITDKGPNSLEEWAIEKTNGLELVRRKGDYWWSSKGLQSVLKGASAIIPEVRRIMAIPLPIGSSSTAGKKPAPKKKPAVKGGTKSTVRTKASPAKKSNAKKTAKPATKKPGTKKAVRAKSVPAAKSNAKAPAVQQVAKPTGLLIADKGKVDSALMAEAIRLIQEKPAEYAKLRTRLRKVPSTNSVLANLRDAPVAEPSAESQIIAHATGKLSDASKAKAKGAAKSKPWVVADEPEVDGDFNAPAFDDNPDLVMPKRSCATRAPKTSPQKTSRRSA
jgi:hypothetical protein